MSNHGPARSNASDEVSLVEDEIVHYNALLVSCGAVLLQHPVVVRSLLAEPHKLDQIFGSLVPSVDPYAPARRQWEAFYLKHFDLRVDLSKVVIPTQQDGFTRLVIVAQSITLNAAMAACKRNFHCWQYYKDLDSDVEQNDRTAQNGPYAVWFRDRIEADEETANLSAKHLASNAVKGITLLERILMELEYFDRTGQHLDLSNWTLCAGSRFAGGSVPRCSWRDVEFGVRWTGVSNRHSALRARVAVS